MLAVEDAFSEVLFQATQQEDRGIVNIMNAILGEGFDMDFVSTEVKVIAGCTLLDSGRVKVSREANDALHGALARVMDGKSAEGLSEKAMDATLNDNIDLL